MNWWFGHILGRSHQQRWKRGPGVVSAKKENRCIEIDILKKDLVSTCDYIWLSANLLFAAHNFTNWQDTRISSDIPNDNVIALEAFPFRNKLKEHLINFDSTHVIKPAVTHPFSWLTACRAYAAHDQQSHKTNLCQAGQFISWGCYLVACVLNYAVSSKLTPLIEL